MGHKIRSNTYNCHLLNSFNMPNDLKKKKKKEECYYLYFTDNRIDLLEHQIAVQVLRELHVLSFKTNGSQPGKF